MTTNAIFFPGRESQTYGMRGDLERVPPGLRSLRARAYERAVEFVDG
jgi:hypothetical protein